MFVEYLVPDRQKNFADADWYIVFCFIIIPESDNGINFACTSILKKIFKREYDRRKSDGWNKRRVRRLWDL